jgi:hypothetical protein
MIYIVLLGIIVVLFIFSWKKFRNVMAQFWLGRGWRLTQEGDYQGAIKAFNEVNKLYKVKDLNPHSLSSKDLTDYIQFVGSSHIGLSIAYAGVGNLDLAKDKLAVAKTSEILYGASSSIEFLQKMELNQLIGIVNKIESHSYSCDKK